MLQPKNDYIPDDLDKKKGPRTIKGTVGALSTLDDRSFRTFDTGSVHSLDTRFNYRPSEYKLKKKVMGVL